jgi:hypothetical protein
MPDKIALKTLEVGDRFIPASRYHKREPIYEVVGKPEYSARHGSPIRACKNTTTRKTESKSCRMEVIKLNN